MDDLIKGMAEILFVFQFVWNLSQEIFFSVLNVDRFVYFNFH